MAVVGPHGWWLGVHVMKLLSNYMYNVPEILVQGTCWIP